MSAISLAGPAHRIDASQAAIPLPAAGPDPATGPSRSTGPAASPWKASQGRAAEPGLTVPHAIAQVCQPPRDLAPQEKQAGRQIDTKAAG